MPNINSTAGIPMGGGGSIGSVTRGVVNANLTYPASQYVVNTAYTYGNSSDGAGIGTLSTSSNSPDLPPIVLNTHDEHGNRVKMTLCPEGSVSSGDCMKLMMLVLAAQTSPGSFNVLAHVKKNNLERHFTYS